MFNKFKLRHLQLNEFTSKLKGWSSEFNSTGDLLFRINKTKPPGGKNEINFQKK